MARATGESASDAPKTVVIFDCESDGRPRQSFDNTRSESEFRFVQCTCACALVHACVQGTCGAVRGSAGHVQALLEFPAMTMLRMPSSTSENTELNWTATTVLSSSTLTAATELSTVRMSFTARTFTNTRAVAVRPFEVAVTANCTEPC